MPQDLASDGARPLPLPQQAEVWFSTVTLGAALLRRLEDDLGPGGRAEVASLAIPEDRLRRLVAYAMLRNLVAPRLGLRAVDVDIQRHCARCGSHEHGKPFVAGALAPAVNISHSGSLAVVALAPHGTAVGIDVEAHRAAFDWRSTRRHVFTTQEWARDELERDPINARWQHWTRKEAVAKATAFGLALELDAIELEEAGVGGWRRALIGDVPSRPQATFYAADVNVGVDFSATLACDTPDGAPPAPPPRVRAMRWDLSGGHATVA